MIRLKQISVFLIAITLAACSSSIKSDVTRFHQLPAPNGETIEVIAMDPNQQQSIEFANYAGMIGSQLGKYGYRPAQNSASQYIAEISYEIHPMGGVVEGRSPVSVGMGVGSGSRSGTSVGFGISTGLGSSRSEEKYLSRLHMNIVDLSSGNRIYEGHVENVSESPSLAQVMPFLVNALFEGFPGESGTSNTVTVKP
ncbi:DUF4136 domain-containing protein [Pseudemcibacter aquimaris]|uniref:DUF4136 domain-containing protein n=1 Tax=Pseudemcibacter aquimaris TaxID=2857064 RepID=UPI00201190D8|nr:DUF4136 domain-containing protein [Pseudemcibacter aquimaris]MCC3862434.1 DUF4136 domain-containing protein [Pseudemcibacter aquimaris]WDU59137.1 DUF4136 domain-containing protein [Pseudemcibacter aquimaris]